MAIKDDIMYQEIVSVSDPECVERFFRKLKQDKEYALTYLAMWDYGESEYDPITREELFQGLAYADWIENETHLALWQAGLDMAILYRKERNAV